MYSKDEFAFYIVTYVTIIILKGNWAFEWTSDDVSWLAEHLQVISCLSYMWHILYGKGIVYRDLNEHDVPRKDEDIFRTLIKDTFRLYCHVSNMTYAEEKWIEIQIVSVL